MSLYKDLNGTIQSIRVYTKGVTNNGTKASYDEIKLAISYKQLVVAEEHNRLLQALLDCEQTQLSNPI